METSTSTPNTISGTYHVVDAQETDEYKLISEGTARMLAPKNNEVFYNNVQVFNRDISILAIKVFAQIRAEEALQRAAKRKQKESADSATATADFVAPKLSILEALSATGLRSIRYWKEIEGLERIVANDLLADAVETIRRNVSFNQIPEGCIIPNHADATEYMYLHRRPDQRFDVVDLDPYGGAAPFLDGAVQSVSDGGLLCITCTDMGVLAGSSPEACYAKYASIPTKGRYCHEMALRIVLSSVQQHASRYKRYIVPLLSLSVDFYVRIFVRVFTSASEVKRAIGKVSTVYQCSACDSFFMQNVGRVVQSENSNSIKFQNSSVPEEVSHTCPECSSVMKSGGPIWSAPIHDVSFVQKMAEMLQSNQQRFATNKRIAGILGIVQKELSDVPLYYELPSLCNRLHCTTPRIAVMRSALANAGYRVSQSHCNADALKTDAPNSVVMDIMRGWVAANPVKPHSETSPAGRFLKKQPSIQADFTERPEMDLRSSKTGVAGFLPNPEAFWGPKPRAGRPAQSNKRSASESESSKKNGKRNKRQKTTASTETETANENSAADTKEQKDATAN